MAEGGALGYKQVVMVLERALGNFPGVSFKSVDNVVLIVKDGVPEVLTFPECVVRRLVMRLAHKYKINPEWFWHPEMIHKDANGMH